MKRALVILLLTGCTCAARHGADAAVGVDAALRPDAGHDAGTDAAVPPDAEPADDCFEAIHSFTGAPCSFEGSCLAGDLCCSASASCFGGRVTHAHAELECRGEVRPAACTSTRGGAAGATPLGPIDHPNAFASFTFAFAVDALILFAREPDLAVCEGDRLAVWLSPRFSDAAGDFTYVGTHDAIAQLVVGGELVRARAIVEITRYEVGPAAPTGQIAGRLRLDAPGWDVTAEFDVAGCDELDRSGP